MEDAISQPLDVNLMFGWPYKFFNTQNIQREYRSKHGGHEVSVIFDDDHDIFHFNCKYEDADHHTINFTQFVNGYIGDELSKSTGDVLGQDAIQIERLHIDDNARSRYFERARRFAAHYQQDYEMLIDSKSFQVILSYSSQIVRNKHINRQLFKNIAQSQDCGLNWLKDGLQVLSENEESLYKTAELFRPVLKLLDGIHVDLYWAENLPQLKFRFRRPARFVDHSIYKLQGFSTTFLDLHLTKWDPISLQDLTLRPVILGKIEYPAGTRNPWLKRKSFQYGLEESHPSQWMATASLKATSIQFMRTERVNQIHNWVQQIDDDLKDSILDSQVSTAVASLTPSRRASEVSSIEESKLEKQESSSEQIAKTDIVERQRLQENYDFGKPRVRAAPRLKAASDQSKGDTKLHLQFIDILEGLITKLISAIPFFNHELSSLTLDIGQLFVLSATVPSVYRPYAGIDQKAFLPADWTRIFPDSHKGSDLTKSYFSRRLTSSADDALYMSTATMKFDEDDRSPRPVFHNKYYLDRTSYKLRCQNWNTGTIASIVIDQKGITEIQSSLQEIGHVNIHFPQYIWDARVTCSTKHELSEDDAEAFQQLLDTIWIGSGEDLPIQEEALYVRKELRMAILSCQQHRERVYRTVMGISDEEAIHLHITRIEELQASEISLAANGVYAFTRALQFSNQANVDDSRQEQNLWYEAHLTSTLVDSLLPHPSESVYLGQTKAPIQTLVPLERDISFRNSLRQALVPLLDIAQTLIMQWNNIGSGDRIEPVRLSGSSVITRSTANDYKARSTGDVLATGSRGRMVARDEEPLKQKT